uniref:E3 ubiquitin protein ligase (EC) n=1 Tax=Ganoderma boninense TaxID=34458 RepID=A0A5K1K223_9APHY|nr:E3 ubiquitin protein ligase (EC [Ganoderma boninense]
MSSLICAICLDSLETKIALSTTCGHVLCSECATRQFALRPTCPVCRREQTLERLLRLYPEYGTAPLETSSGAGGTTTASSPEASGLHAQVLKPHLQQHTLSSPSPPVPDADSPLPSPRTLRTPSVHSLWIWIDVTGTHFPWTQAGVVPAVALDGSPVFLGLAAFKEGLHPCKICVEPQCRPVPRVPYGGEEVEHEGTTLLLPFDPRTTLKRVVAAHGQIQEGRRPVEGGYERAGEEALFHARAVVEGVNVLGKAEGDGHLACGSLETSTAGVGQAD